MIVAVDFDGVIFDKRKGEMLPGAVEGMKKLSKGNELYIFTSRPDYERGVIKSILDSHDVPYERIQCGKPQYDTLIDDHAQEFLGW